MARQGPEAAARLRTDLTPLAPVPPVSPPLEPTAETELLPGSDEVITTLNLGFLRVLGKDTVPGAAARRAALPESLGRYLTEVQPAVLAIQECYLAEDRALLQSIGDTSGYVSVDERPDDDTRTGLLLLVRRAGLTVQAAGFDPLPGDMFDVAGYRRGVLWVRLGRATGPTLLVTNVHLTPVQARGLSWRRTVQAVQIWEGLAFQTGVFDCLAAEQPCAAVVTGDFNLAPAWDFSLAREPLLPRPHASLIRWLSWDKVLYQLLGSQSASEAEDLSPGIWTLDPRNPTWDGYPLNAALPAMRPDLAFVAGSASMIGARRVLDQVEGDSGYPPSDHHGLEITVRLVVPGKPLHG